jgi:hypothetical protein
MTERNDEIAAFQILWPYSGWQAFELEELSLHLHRGITDPSINSMLEWA